MNLNSSLSNITQHQQINTPPLPIDIQLQQQQEVNLQIIQQLIVTYKEQDANTFQHSQENIHLKLQVLKSKTAIQSANLTLIKQQASQCVIKKNDDQTPPVRVQSSSQNQRINLKHRDILAKKLNMHYDDVEIKSHNYYNQQGSQNAYSSVKNENILSPQLESMNMTQSAMFVDKADKNLKPIKESEIIRFKENQIQQILSQNQKISADIANIFTELVNQKNINQQLTNEIREYKCMMKTQQNQTQAQKNQRVFEQPSNSQDIFSMKQMIKNLQSLLKISETEIQKLKYQIQNIQQKQNDEGCLQIMKKGFSLKQPQPKIGSIKTIKKVGNLQIRKEPSIYSQGSSKNQQNQQIGKSVKNQKEDFLFQPIMEEKSPSFQSSDEMSYEEVLTKKKLQNDGLRRRSKSFGQLEMHILQ